MSRIITPNVLLRVLDRTVMLVTTLFFWGVPLAVAAWLAYYKPFIAEIDVFLAVFVAALPLLLTAGR